MITDNTGDLDGEAFKRDLAVYVQDARDVLLWKLDGLDEYDVRRPLTPSGTNLLGLVKHVTAAEILYLGEAFGRPFPAPGLWITGDAEPDSDLWATPGESREEIVDRYRAVWAHSDATIAGHSLHTTVEIPFGDRARQSLHRILVHLIAETHRHAGHADVVRELVDGTAGLRAGARAVAPGDAAVRAAHRARVEEAARAAGQGRPAPGGAGSRAR
ncbi:DinB family protein (plasmid) [Streptomyces sp. BI20]|uniref:DinB family protein n=1 Tax=Streptomyces sp. BI20 TaxID=3403460 RepID=UPI003C715DEC